MKRGSEFATPQRSKAAVQRRLADARKELEQADKYHHQVINDDLDTAVARLRELVEAALA